jgi:hypothetical protein
MTTDIGESDFPKELFVVIPLVGSAIAISYDVGYFYAVDINFFTIFSIAEHIVFALEATPLALLLAVSVVMFFKTGINERLEQAGARHAATGAWWPTIALAMLVLVLIVLLYVGWIGTSVLAGIVGGGVSIWLKSTPQEKWMMFSAAGCTVIVISFAAGFDMGMRYLRFGPPRHSIQTDASESLSVKIIRTGERGVLYFEPKSKEVGFIKWASIKKISETW